MAQVAIAKEKALQNVNPKNECKIEEENIENSKYYKLYISEKKKSLEKEEQISQLLITLEDLETKLENLASMAQDDLLQQDETRQTMQREIINLASRNAVLEKEKEDLIELLEQRDYDAEMSKQPIEFTKFSHENNIMSNDINLPNALNLDEEILEYENDHQTPAEPKQESKESKYRKNKQDKKEVPDVVREYLNIAASAILINHPKVTTIASSELVKKVKNYPFEDYYNTMLKIVKNEEKKLIEKEKEIAKKKLQIEQDKEKKKGGLLFRFLSKLESNLTSRATTINNSPTRDTAKNKSPQLQHKIIDKLIENDNKVEDNPEEAKEEKKMVTFLKSSLENIKKEINLNSVKNLKNNKNYQELILLNKELILMKNYLFEVCGYLSDEVFSVNVNEYEKWNVDEIMLWLCKMDKGKNGYEEVIDKLYDGLKKDKLKGKDLIHIDKSYLSNVYKIDGLGVKQHLIDDLETLLDLKQDEGVGNEGIQWTPFL